MIHNCTKIGKIERLWGYFIKHLLQMKEAGIQVEYVRKGEVVLNGIRFQPIYFENTMRYEPVGNKNGKHNVILIGHDIEPLIKYLKTVADDG